MANMSHRESCGICHAIACEHTLAKLDEHIADIARRGAEELAEIEATEAAVNNAGFYAHQSGTCDRSRCQFCYAEHKLHGIGPCIETPCQSCEDAKANEPSEFHQLAKQVLQGGGRLSVVEVAEPSPNDQPGTVVGAVSFGDPGRETGTGLVGALRSYDKAFAKMREALMLDRHATPEQVAMHVGDMSEDLFATHDAKMREWERATLAEKRIAELESERDAYKRAKSENDERFMLERDEARQRAVELERELGKMRACFPYCDQHRPLGMRVAKCCECDWTKLHNTLSEICYATEEPNEHGYSIYDADPNPDMVLERVTKRITDLEGALVVSERGKAEAIDGAQGWRARCKQQEHEHFAVMDELWDIVLPWVGSTTKLANGLRELVRLAKAAENECTPAERALVEAVVTLWDDPGQDPVIAIELGDLYDEVNAVIRERGAKA